MDKNRYLSIVLIHPLERSLLSIKKKKERSDLIAIFLPTALLSYLSLASLLPLRPHLTASPAWSDHGGHNNVSVEVGAGGGSGGLWSRLSPGGPPSSLSASPFSSSRSGGDTEARC